MCGIVGAVAATGAELPAAGGIEQAVAALRHRGPDGSGIARPSAAVVLAHTRLAIVDLEHGEQPMHNEDGTVSVVYNGEIWNHRELRQELAEAGHRFRTCCDTEVLVHGYEEWGEDLPKRLDGMFAFALWDAGRQRLLLARDRVGKKPLYLLRTTAGIAFASDVRSLQLAAGRQPRLDRSRVAEFLFQRYVSTPHTLFADVEKLPPGHLLVYDRRRAESRAFWALTPGPAAEMPPSELRDVLRDAVARRLMGDVPVGMLLSGGVDSIAILGLMHEAGAEKVPTFTVGFADALYDERPAAAAAARRYRTDHHELVVGARDFAEVLPRLAWYRDEPMAEPSEIALLLLAELAGRHVKVVLTGDGGDELFGGYPKYRAERLLGLPLIPAHRLAATVQALGRRPTSRRLGRAGGSLRIADEVLRWASWFRSFGPAELVELLTPGLAESADPERLSGPLRAALEPYRELDRSRRLLTGDFLTYLPENMLARSDRLLMAASVEGRMPLLDVRVVERVADVAGAERIGMRFGKRLLRRAVLDLLPEEAARGPKRGFTVPIARFLVEQERLAERVLLDERCLERRLFSPDALHRLVRAPEPPGAERALQLFTLISLELWCRANVDTITASPPESLDALVPPAAAERRALDLRSDTSPQTVGSGGTRAPLPSNEAA